MPVMIPTLRDPTDLVMQGIQMWLPAEPFKFPDVPEYLEGKYSPLIIDPPDRLPLTPVSILATTALFGMVDVGTFLFGLLPDQAINAGIRGNACVCTPCGVVVPVLLGHQWLVNDIGQSTVNFVLPGVTRDAAGAILGNCRVMVMDVGRQQIDGAPIVGETISDGSGNYSVPVPMNTAYQVLSYKPGVPDVFGTTLNTYTPVQG